MTNEHFDLIIIGAGSGNSIINSAMDHWKIAIIERETFGGTCLNKGCIPSKMFVLPAEIAHDARAAKKLGVDASVNSVDWPSIVERVFGRIDPIAIGGERYRESLPNVTVFHGNATFTGNKTLVVDVPGAPTVEITGDRIVLAAGARSFVPDIPGLDAINWHTSDTIMRLPSLPSRLVIVGGGFIAAEMAGVFAGFGSQVTIVNRSGRLLMIEDDDVSQRFTNVAREYLDVVTGAQTLAVSPNDDGSFTLNVTTAMGDISVEGDVLLIAAGRMPNGAQLGVELTGVGLDAKGNVITDQHLLAAPGIWALGDIRGRHQLKHWANLEAKIVQHNLLHPESPRVVPDNKPVPYAVFSHPQIGAIGLTERAAMRDQIPHIVITHEYRHTAYGWALEDVTSFVKLLADPTGTYLLGAHIIGPQAPTLVQLLVQGMHLGNTIWQMAHDVIYIHPALSEVVEQALLKVLETAAS